MSDNILHLIAQSKETIGIILTWLAGSVTHILNKMRKGERLTFWQHIAHIIMSWFVGLLAYFACEQLGIDGSARGIIIGISSYLGIQILDALDMIKPSNIYEFIIDIIQYKIWKKK